MLRRKGCQKRDLRKFEVVHLSVSVTDNLSSEGTVVNGLPLMIISFSCVTVVSGTSVDHVVEISYTSNISSCFVCVQFDV